MRQLLQEVGTKATCPRSTFAKKLAQMKTAAEEKVYEAANMTTDKHVEYLVCLSHAETEATTWSIADLDSFANPLERDIYGITLNQQIPFKKELSIRLIKFETRWKTIAVHELRKTIDQCVIHFGYP